MIYSAEREPLYDYQTVNAVRIGGVSEPESITDIGERVICTRAAVPSHVDACPAID